MSTVAKKSVKGTKSVKASKKVEAVSGPEAAVLVLKAAKKPLTPKVIALQAIERGLWKPAGATPWDSLRVAMLRQPKRFRRNGNSEWALVKKS